MEWKWKNQHMKTLNIKLKCIHSRLAASYVYNEPVRPESDTAAVSTVALGWDSTGNKDL
jgi:hypothetical protein